MNTTFKTLAVFLAAGLCATARAGLFSDNFDMIVVAERAKDAPAPQDGPVACAVVDGGYIEAGDAVAGDEPPPADFVRSQVQGALAQQGFRGGPAPALLITYHWGVLRIDHQQIRVPYGINSNLDARINLVSTEATGDEVENHILAREKGGGQTNTEASPPILVGPLETIVENARKPRYFIILTAYDYQSVVQHQPKMVWRTKLSAQETSGSMQEIIPSLIAQGAPYFAKDILLPKIVEASITKGNYPQPDSSSPQTAVASSDSGAVDSVVKHEHLQFSGGGEAKG